VSQSNVLPKITDLRTDSESWQEAGKLISALGPIFPPIAAYVRILNMPIAGNPRARATKDRVLAECLRTPTISEGLAQLVDNFYPRRLPLHRSLTPSDLTELVDYESCAALLTLLYLFRKTKAALVAHSQWQILSELVHERADVGYYLGLSLPGFGGALGLLIGGMRFLSLGFIASRDPDRYGDYEEHLRARRLLFDVAYEIKTWGFSHAQCAALYLQRMGYGRKIPLSIAEGLSPRAPYAPPNALSSKLRAVSIWIESLVRCTKPPLLLEESPFGMTKQETEQLLASVKTLMESQVGLFWLEPREVREKPKRG
jgi:hypothetical protein